MADIESILSKRKEGLSYRAIASTLQTTIGTVAGVIKRHSDKAGPRPKNVIPFSSLPKPQVITRPENQDTDMARWEAERNKLLKGHDFIRVMHMNDLHLPYYDSAALALWFEIAERFQPHVVVVGSDMLDLPTISHFERDPDIDVGDWHFQAREYYWPLIHQLDRLLPNALLVWINGNHERRAVLKIKQESSPIMGMANWKETVRCGGRVSYLGRTESVEIGSLKVAHGDKTGKTAADKMSLLWPTLWVNFGHIHKHIVSENGRSFSNGKLCKAPHFNDYNYPVAEVAGTSTMTVDTLPFGGVSWSHHSFVQAERGLWSAYGSEIISVNRAAAESEAA